MGPGRREPGGQGSDLVLQLVECVEKDVPAACLAGEEVEEAFLTSTTRGVQPISEIDGRRLGAGPGPLTAAAAAALAALMESTDEP